MIALTKEEFIRRSMAGEKFKGKGNTLYHYNDNFPIPFRVNDNGLVNSWSLFDGTTKAFEVVKEEVILYEYLYKHPHEGWTFSTSIYTEKQAATVFCGVKYNKTGRSFKQSELEDT